MSRMLALLTVVAMGFVALFGFFAALGLFEPVDVLWLCAIAAVLVIVTAIHSAIVRRQFRTHGNQEFFRPSNRLRERRGF
jgi:hypothetical protein